MPQIIGKKGFYRQQAPVTSGFKYPGNKTVPPPRVTTQNGRYTNAAITTRAKSSLVQCSGGGGGGGGGSGGGQKILKPASVKSQTSGGGGLYHHRKCSILPDGGKTKNHSSLDPGNKTRGTLTCPPTFRRLLPVTPRCTRKSLSMIDLSPAAAAAAAAAASAGGKDDEIGHPLGWKKKSESGGSSCWSLHRACETVEGRMNRRRDNRQPHGPPTGIEGHYSGNGKIAKMWLDETNFKRLEEEQEQQRVVDGAAGTVCHLLAINAWRKRREEVNSLRQTVQQLGQRVDHLHIQIVVLRRLLHTENCRVEKLSGEAHRAKIQSEEASRQREQLKKEKEQTEDELRRFKRESEEQSVATENLRNESMTLKNQVDALDKQISRDREKLLRLREDNKTLLDKVCTAETLANERGIRADDAEATVQELLSRLRAQDTRIGELERDYRESIKDFKTMELEKSRLEKRLRSSQDSGRALGSRAANLEMQLSDREAALRRIESAYNAQLNELTEIRERIMRQSQQVGWSSRVLQIAGSVVWAPRAILRSLTFLSNSGSH